MDPMDPLVEAYLDRMVELQEWDVRLTSGLFETIDKASRPQLEALQLVISQNKTTQGLLEGQKAQISALEARVSQLLVTSSPQALPWPEINFEHLPPDFPSRLAGVYRAYYERHLGVGEQARELQRELQCYIPLSAAEDGEEPHPLQEVMEEFLQDAARPCLLLTGDSGAGKSLALKSLEAQTWKGGQSNSNSNPLPTHFPLFIDLKGVKNGEPDLPSYALKSMGYSNAHIQELKASSQFLFLLDGYDELGTWQQTSLEELLSGWRGKVIVSCRSQYLDRNPYYWDDWFVLEGSSKYEYTLRPFDQSQIEHYLDQFVQEGAVWTKERYLEAIATMRGLKKLVTSPLLLRLVVEALPKLPKNQKQVTRSDIYEKFIESWFERARKRMRGREGVKIPTLDQVYDFTGRLAHKMIQLGEFEAYTGTSEWSPFFSPEMEEALELAPIRSIGEGGYQFFHKSLIEFFASQHLFRALLMDKDHNNRTLQNLHTQQILKSLGSHPLNEKRSPEGVEGKGQEALLISEPAVLDLLVDGISRVPHREERLLEIVLASRNCPQVSTAAANAITLLNRGGYSLARLDLSNIQVPYAALDGALMHHTNLVGAVLRGVTLTRAQLVGANLKGADLREVSFGQWPMLKTDSGVNSAVYSPDGSRVALALDNHTVEIWDPISTKRLMVLQGHANSVTSVAFRPDGKAALTASHDHTARLWDLTSGNGLLTLEGHTDWVRSAAFSPDGKTALTASDDHTARLWDLTSGNGLLTLKGHTWDVNSAAFSPDGKTALTASRDHTARLWDLTSGKGILTLEGHTGIVTSAAFSPDGKAALTASSDETTRLWDLTSGKGILTLEGHTGIVTSAAFSPDGKAVLTASWDSTARLWDLTSGKNLLTLEGHSDWVQSAAFSPDGKAALTASHDHTARLWNLTSGKGILTLEGHTGSVNSAAFSPDGKAALTASWDKTARLWDLTSGKGLLTFEGHTRSVISAAFSPDGKAALTAGSDHTARLWNLTSGKGILTLEGHTGSVNSAAFSSGGKAALTASWDKTARLWDLTSGKGILTLVGHSNGVISAAFSPDGKAALTASRDHTARLWDLTSGKGLLTLEGHTHSVISAAFSPDGKTALTASDDHTARLWDLTSGKGILILEGHTGWVNSAAFSPDGKAALTASSDETTRLWDLTSGKGILTLEGHTSHVSSAAFSPDGKAALTASGDHTARLWDLTSGKCLQVLYGHTAWVTSATWNAQNEILTSSHDHTVALWRQVETSQGLRYCIVWRSAPTDLVADGCLIGGARMSNRNAVLLQQKGTDGSAITEDGNSNNRA